MERTRRNFSPIFTIDAEAAPAERLMFVKTLREYNDPVLAGIVQSFLMDNGVDATLFDQGASAWTAGRLLIPVRLTVPFEQEEVAENLLKQIEEKNPD